MALFLYYLEGKKIIVRENFVEISKDGLMLLPYQFNTEYNTDSVVLFACFLINSQYSEVSSSQGQDQVL